MAKVAAVEQANKLLLLDIAEYLVPISDLELVPLNACKIFTKLKEAWWRCKDESSRKYVALQKHVDAFDSFCWHIFQTHPVLRR